MVYKQKENRKKKKVPPLSSFLFHVFIRSLVTQTITGPELPLDGQLQIKHSRTCWSVHAGLKG